VTLVGTRCNRDAVGARAVARVGARRILRQRSAGQSFASDHDPRLHFGLGEAATVDALEVLWPDGSTDVWKELPGNAWVRLRQGDPECEVVRRW